LVFLQQLQLECEKLAQVAEKACLNSHGNAHHIIQFTMMRTKQYRKMDLGF
jgi:hypothetical protein